MNNVVEVIGYALVVAFLWFVWPPLVLLGAGLLLVVWANTRSHHGRFTTALGAALGAAVMAARRSYTAARAQPSAMSDPSN